MLLDYHYLSFLALMSCIYLLGYHLSIILSIIINCTIIYTSFCFFIFHLFCNLSFILCMRQFIFWRACEKKFPFNGWCFTNLFLQICSYPYSFRKRSFHLGLKAWGRCCVLSSCSPYSFVYTWASHSWFHTVIRYTSYPKGNFLEPCKIVRCKNTLSPKKNYKE